MAPAIIEPTIAREAPLTLSRRDVLLLGLAVIIAIAALSLARIGVIGPPESFTQLWLQGGSADAPLMVAIESHESGTVGYRLDLVVDGLVRRAIEFELVPGEQKLIAPPKLAAGATFEARLALQSKPAQVYRRVLLHVPVPTPTPRPTAAS